MNEVITNKYVHHLERNTCAILGGADTAIYKLNVSDTRSLTFTDLFLTIAIYCLIFFIN